jgi:putative metallohydrolase (TIGR04338 family)
MTYIRDSQRSKVYKAERTLDQFYKNGMSIEDVREFVDKIMDSNWLNGKYPRAYVNGKVIVKDGRGRRKAGGCFAYITMPKWSRSKLVVLHELAHSITDRQYEGYGVASHGREFCSIYISLIRRWMSKDVGRALKAAFKTCRVKHIVRSR